MPDFPAGLLDYFAVREQQRQDDIEQAWPHLQCDVTRFIEQHRTDPNLGPAVAKLVRELAVAAFVRGTMHAVGLSRSELEQPSDSFMLFVARETTASMFEQFPAWALLDGRTDNEDVDG
jgi:hypothetical protein